MQIDSSASRTGSEPASAWEWATTVRIPISRQVRSTRRAISPRLAMRILWNMGATRLPARLYEKQGLAELHRLGVLDEDLDHASGHLRLDLVHELHRLDDAERLALFHRVALAHEWRRLGVGGPVEGADHGRLDGDPARYRLGRLARRFGLGEAGRHGGGRGPHGHRRMAADHPHAQTHALDLELGQIVGHRQLHDLLGRPLPSRRAAGRPRLAG